VTTQFGHDECTICGDTKSRKKLSKEDESAFHKIAVREGYRLHQVLKIQPHNYANLGK